MSLLFASLKGWVCKGPPVPWPVHIGNSMGKGSGAPLRGARRAAGGIGPTSEVGCLPFNLGALCVRKGHAAAQAVLGPAPDLTAIA